MIYGITDRRSPPRMDLLLAGQEGMPLALSCVELSSGGAGSSSRVRCDLKLRVALSNSVFSRATRPRRECICLGPRIRKPSRSTSSSSVPKPMMSRFDLVWVAGDDGWASWLLFLGFHG